MLAYQPKTNRDLLIDLGVGRFNATMLVQTMMMAPATTEAASAPVMLLVQHLQMALADMGAPVKSHGLVDPPTDHAMKRLAGDKWMFRTWFDVTRMVVAARKQGKKLTPTAAPVVKSDGMGFIDLPDVPGGLLTYALAGYVGYRIWKRKRG